MTQRKGLLTKAVALKVIRALTLLASLGVFGAQAFLLLSGSSSPLPLLHTLTVVLIGLATISLLVLPLAVGTLINALALLGSLWAWAVTRSNLLGFDTAVLVMLIGLASLQQRRRARRILRLKQQLDDLEEEFYLKEQALRISRQAHDGLQRKLSRYQQLQTIAEHLSRLLNLEGIGQLAVDRAFELIGKSDVCLLFLVDKERQELALYASKKAAGVPVIRTKQGDQFDHYVLRTHRPLLVNDVRRDFRFGSVGTTDRPLGAVIACPVIVAESAEGVLRLDSPNAGVYTQDDLRFLDILLDLVDTAIANARLFAQTQQLAMTDGLTGVLRRQPFLDQLTRELARANRTREPLAVLMLDIDDFKRYNDTFGHPAGDLVLKTVAEVMRSTVPPDGMCGRYGGEEFAMLLPKASGTHGAEIAERIRQRVEEKVRTVGRDSPVTVSLGVAAFPDDAQSELELIRQADQRLYQAKRAGKNRVRAS